ncbi:MAG: phosphate acyltransferase [Synergistaceae bacterium]|nr:phosphate acyltransferase [Synergistaceae bacterium]
MYKTFDEMIKGCGCLGGSSVVAAAADRETVMAIKLALDHGLGHAVLVGDEKAIRPIVEELGISGKVEIVHAEGAEEAAKKAVALVREGTGDALMKGLVNTVDFLRAVLDKENGLRTGHILSHLAVMEIPGERHLSFCADSGFIVAPTLEEKKHILRNALRAIHALGYEHVNVACLAANERVDSHVPASVDAAALVEAWRKGEFDNLPCTCTVEGPMAVDVVASKEAAEHKGIRSVIAGKVDLTIVPDIECGNVHCKTLVHYCKAKFAGVVLGAKRPIILVSRTDDPETKFHGIALSCLIAGGM